MEFYFRHWEVVLLVSTVYSNVATAAESPPIVQTVQGVVKGYTDEATDGREFSSFRGIPYAEPPVGELRFKNPKPAAGWEGTLETINPGAPCPQFVFPDNLAGKTIEMFGHEDCLFLNVFTPNIGASENEGLPVMVFFHGGAWILGDAAIYPANSLLTEDVVLVVVQYRLGTLGFLSTEDNVAPGNLGLKDQSMALSWVQQNIHGFGGNPKIITIFGESAGAASTHFHLLAEQSHGLFHRAILQSGTATCSWALADDARVNAYKIGEHLGCAHDSKQVSSEELIKCLQGKSVLEIANKYALFFEFGIFPLAMAPIVDGEFLTAHPSVLMKEGKQSEVDLMAGVTTDEGAFLSSMFYSSEHMFDGLQKNFNIVAPASLDIPKTSFEPLTQVLRVYKRYFGQSLMFSEQADEYTKMSGDRFFNVPNDNTVLEHLKITAGTAKRVFLYEFSYRGDQSFLDMFPMQYLKDPETAKKWVSHSDDIAYLFPGSVLFQNHKNDADKEMTKKMVKLWANFAKTGNPTPDDSLGYVWEAAEEGQLRHLVIQQEPYMRDDQRETIRKFWNSFPLPENMLANPEKFENIVEEMARLEMETAGDAAAEVAGDHEEL